MQSNTQQTNIRVNDMVDKVYVLSVQSFTERIAHIERLMAQHQIAFEFIFAHDIPALTEAQLSQTFAPATDLSMAQKSLVLKHIQAWQYGVEHGYQQVLVFEDDVLLVDDFTQKLNNIMQASQSLPTGQLIFLGGADTKVPDSFLLSKDTLIENPIATAEGYISDLTAMQRRMNWLSQHQVTLPADHLIKQIDAAQQTKQYWPRHAIVEQGSVTGIFDSHLDAHRQKHSKAFNILRNRWNKFQRHQLRFWAAKIRQLFS